MEKMIYLDHAATTSMKKEVLDAMMPYFTQYYGNAGSEYGLGVESRKALNASRRTIARTLDAKPEEIFFTSGGSESDNWAIKGIAKTFATTGKHIITSCMEHPAVLNTCKQLEQEGYSVTYLSVDADGYVRLEELERAIRPDTILISIMYANNEIGTIQPVREIARIAHEHRILFHVDAVQAYGQIPISVKEDGFDLLSASAHKFHGPKGVGFLYIKGYQKIVSFINGGGQERGLRAGTENIPGIVGMAKAAELAHESMKESMMRKVTLRNLFYELLCENLYDLPGNVNSNSCKISVNGYLDLEQTKKIVSEMSEDALFSYYQSEHDSKKRMPGNLNISFNGAEAQQVVIHLDLKGICVSGGSACSTFERKPSHVISSLNKNPLEIKGAVRFSFGEENTQEQIERVVDILMEMYHES